MMNHQGDPRGRSPDVMQRPAADNAPQDEKEQAELLERLRRQRDQRMQQGGGHSQGQNQAQNQPQRRPAPPSPRQQASQAPPKYAEPASKTGQIQSVRQRILESYAGYMVFISIVFIVNSAMTTIVGARSIWAWMFPGAWSGWGWVFGILAVIACFVGQIWNSDWELPNVDDDELEEFDPDDVDRLDLSKVENRVDRNKKLTYFLWLTPDALFTQYFWIVPFIRVITHLFYGVAIPAEDLHGVARFLSTAWSISFGVFLSYVLFIGVAAVASSAFGVASAYFPEKGFLGPRYRASVKQYIREKVEALAM